MNIPLYDVIINEAGGFTALSLVKNPAIQVDFIALAEQEEIKLQSTEDHHLFGPILIAGKPIYRRNAEGKEYYIRFSKEIIAQLAEKALADNALNKINLQHNGKQIEGVSLVQLFIIDREKGINPEKFSSIADGSLMAEFRVDNEDVWEQIQSGEINGFSGELLADYVKIDMQSEELAEESLLREIISLLRMIKSKM